MLLLHNFNQDHPATAQFDQGLLETLRASRRFDVRVSAEYVNLPSFEALPSYVAETGRYLALKYSHWKPDAVFAGKALTGLYTHALRETFRDIPCFIALDRDGSPVAEPHFKVLSWSTTLSDIEKNIDLILKLRPETRTVLVVLGASEEERRLADDVGKVVARYTGRLSFTLTSDLSHAAMLEQVAVAADDAAILFIRYALDRDGRSYIPVQVADDIVQQAVVPVFVMARQMLGSGAVGGYATDFRLFGRRTALWMLDALDGREPSEESLAAEVSSYAFDQRALLRFGISESAVPDGSRVLFRDETVWGQYKYYILSGFILMVAETLLVLGLAVNRLRRRRAEAALAALNTTLEARVLERTSELHEANDELHRAKAELEALNRSLERMSRTDSLTGLPNRRHVEEALHDAMALFSRYNHGFVVAMVDIDHFKRVNDDCGHEVGDRLLCEIARIMTDCVRECDLAARWGGEEFLLLLPGTGLEGATSLLERIRRRIEAAALDCDMLSAPITATIGAAEVRSGDMIDDVIRRADAALYRGKGQGRNRVVVD